ncbi:MAG: PKD domain-containing protein [Planctomycetes bacterium]|nr:PKD domain-containing protein [Planctomycetota bacterium]
MFTCRSTHRAFPRAATRDSLARGAALLALASATLVAGGCESKIDPAPLNGSSPVEYANDNLNVGFFPGLDFTATPILERAATGGLIPGSFDTPDRSVVFMAFVTAADASLLDRQGPLESNGAADVFVAAIVDSDVDRNAFSQSLAGKFRSPRCITCHSVASMAGTSYNPFAPTVTHPIDLSVEVVTDPAVCAPCHTDTAPEDLAANTRDWKAPELGFDFRGETVAQLNARAVNAPEGEEFHFFTDSRVLWALDNGALPANAVADDNRNGLAECEDFDDVRRTVAGGKEHFLDEVLGWLHTGQIADTSRAVKDVALCSQVDLGAGGQSGNAASFAPTLTYVPNPQFDRDQAAVRPAGTLFVAFATGANDLVPGATQTAQDVVRVTLDVWLDRDARTGAYLPGSIDLRFRPASAELVSVSSLAPLAGGNNASGAPSINADGTLVAFESTATNLGTFVQGNNVNQPDVFVRKLGGSEPVRLVSRNTASAVVGGSGGSSRAPSISADGTAVAFESNATNLVAGDSNNVQDVFFVRLDASSGATTGPATRASVDSNEVEGTSGDCRRASVAVNALGEVLVAFESDKTDLEFLATPLLATTNVYLRLAGQGLTRNLSAVFDAADAPTVANGDSRSPHLDDLGTAVVFETDADNLDELRTVDINHASDIVRADIGALVTGSGFARLHRISITADGGDALLGGSLNFPASRPHSTSAVFGSFRGPKASAFARGFAVFDTDADNLGAADTEGTVISFLKETVSAPPPGAAPIVAFTQDVSFGAAPLTVNFTAQPSSATNWCWDFGDGEPATAQSVVENPSHVYLTDGTFTVTLTERWPGGSVTSRTVAAVVVTPAVTPPTWTQVYASMAADPVNGCLSCHVTAELAASGAPFEMDTQASGFANMVNVLSTNGPCAGTARVIPGDSAGSTLSARLDGISCGQQMFGLSPQEILNVKAWIDAGALNN